MTLFVQEVINGILLGALFALMSVGLSMVFGILKTANFAYGALYMLGGYVAYWSVALLHFPFWAALLTSFVALFLVGMVVEKVGFSHFRGNEDATLMFGLGLALLMRGAAILAWGSQNRQIPGLGSGAVLLGPFVFPSARLYASVVAIIIFIVNYYLIVRTRWGRIVRAVADDAVRATLLGVDAAWQYRLVFGLGCGIAAVASVMLIPVFGLAPTVDDSAMYTGFAVVILGGLGSIVGCVVGGMILGVVTVFAFAYTDGVLAPVFPLIVLFIVLIAKPEGLFGTQRRVA
jgi:branched-chain amino acid transport system permease protein